MVEVRPATRVDAAVIREVNLAAFPTPMEADLIEQLERDGDTILSLVAVDRATVVGHILFSRMKVQGDGRDIDALGLAPVAVMPNRQGEGIGSALVRSGLNQVRSAGTAVVFLLGEPAYYARFGFDVATAAPFASPYSGPYFQAKALAPEFVSPSSGRADYAPAFAALA